MKGVFAVTQFARPLAAFVGGRAAAVCAGNPTVVAAKVFGGARAAFQNGLSDLLRFSSEQHSRTTKRALIC